VKIPSYKATSKWPKALLEATIVLLAVTIAAIAVIQKATDLDIAKWPQHLHFTLRWCREEGWWLIPMFTVVAALIKLLKEWLERQWVWSVVASIVDRIASDAFKTSTDPTHHNRATLFKHQSLWFIWPWRKWYWPWGRGRWPMSGWLVPVVRSGNTSRRTTAVFLAPDDADHAEGVAGVIWAKRREVAKSFSKELDQNANGKDIQLYAAETFISEETVQHRLSSGNAQPVSFKGLTIEVGGRPWGVLLLDSRKPNVANNASIELASHAFVLEKLLERT